MRRPYWMIAIAAAVLVAVPAYWLTARGSADVDDSTPLSRAPRITPDYSGVVIPPNIAPLNFVICEQGDRFLVKIRPEEGNPIEIASRSRNITIPLKRWRSVLEASRGKELRLDVYAEIDGRWQKYQTIANRVAQEPIDEYLVYRLTGSVYREWNRISVQQRNLTDYRESVVLDGLDLDHACVNCHTFTANRPNPMCIGMRSEKLGSGTIVASGGEVKKVGSKFGYTAWHPSGRMAAYSVNQVRQFFHSAGAEVRDVIDLDAALGYYTPDTEKAKLVPLASDKDRLETYPTWSPDGQYLYYCSTPILWEDRSTIPADISAEIKYDLMRIRYDIDGDTWGEPETVLSAKDTGLSILEPRISPDGKWLLFCMCDYGCFPIYQPSSDLYLMDLETGDYRKLDINSALSESWHSWSSNSRWIVFSSRRRGGVFTRPYISFVDAAGTAHKPFVLPQEYPDHYDSFLKSMSVPELVTAPMSVDAQTLAKAGWSEDTITADAVTGATQVMSEPWEQAHQ